MAPIQELADGMIEASRVFLLRMGTVKNSKYLGRFRANIGDERWNLALS
jgi:hypothetical protein